MKEEIKISWNFCAIYYIKTMETYCVSCKNTLLPKIQVSVKLSKIDQCIYQTVLFVARKFQLLLKIKKLIVFQMINLKWIKLLTNFNWLKTNLC